MAPKIPPTGPRRNYQVSERSVENPQAQAETLPRSDPRQRIRETTAAKELMAGVGVGSGWRVRARKEWESTATPEASAAAQLVEVDGDGRWTAGQMAELSLLGFVGSCRIRFFCLRAAITRVCCNGRDGIEWAESGGCAIRSKAASVRIAKDGVRGSTRGGWQRQAKRVRVVLAGFWWRARAHFVIQRPRVPQTRLFIPDWHALDALSRMPSSQAGLRKRNSGGLWSFNPGTSPQVDFHQTNRFLFGVLFFSQPTGRSSTTGGFQDHRQRRASDTSECWASSPQCSIC